MNHAIREALAGFRRTPVLAGLSAGMIGLALFVVGLFGLAAHNLRLALAEIEERVEVVVYLRDDASIQEVDLARTQLGSLPQVALVRYVSKEEALEYARSIPEFGDAYEGLSVNPLPASLEITLREGERNEEGIEAVAQSARIFPFVEDVQFGRDWVETLFAIRRMAGVAAVAIGAAFAAVAALIIGTALKIAIFARRDEIYIMRLVGARNSFIRRPFLLEGAMAGLLGGALAVGLTWAVYRAVETFQFELEWIPPRWALLGVAAGIVFGGLASRFAVQRHLREV